MIGGSAAAGALAIGARRRSCAQDKTKITWWHISTIESEKAAFQKLADDYVAANPNVEIEITVLENEAFKQKIATAMQSGEPPDIFQSWGGGVLFQYADAGLVKDISAELAADGWGDSFFPAALGLYTRDAATYGVPWRIGMVCFWYNKDLFAQAGIEAPPTTWDEMSDHRQTLKDAGITPITVGEGDKWPGHFYWVYLAIRTGGKAAFDAAYTGTGSFADPPFVEAGTLLETTRRYRAVPGWLPGRHLSTKLLRSSPTARPRWSSWANGRPNSRRTNRKVAKDLATSSVSLPSQRRGRRGGADRRAWRRRRLRRRQERLARGDRFVAI